MRKTLIFAFLILMSGAIFADFYVSDIIVPKVVLEDTNFEVNVIVVNTYNEQKNVDLNIEVYNPRGVQLFEKIEQVSIGANSSHNLLVNIEIPDTNASTAQHLVRARITTQDENPINNTGQKWFMIKQAQKSVPVPDMPIYFGFIIAFIAVVFLTNKKEKK